MKILKSTRQRLFKKRIFGFDIETCNDNKDFVMASIVGDDRTERNGTKRRYEKVFYNKEDVTNEIKTNWLFRNSIIFATNLSFDFFGTFFKKEDSKNFFTLFRGTDLLMAKTQYGLDGFTKDRKRGTKTLKSLTFLDTMNYAKMSVKSMGSVIGIEKLSTPTFIGKKPTTCQMKELVAYNIRDSTISFEFMKFLINAFEQLGGTFKNTIASTAMSTFKNKYLDDDFFVHPIEVLIDEFKAYYGGRTEALQRGHFGKVNYYDFNSLYPSVMFDNIFPDPNTLRTSCMNDAKYIKNFEGVADIEIEVPKCHIPVLPYRAESGRVIFPYGKLKGWYSNVEIRKAMEEGAILTKVHKTYYYMKTCSPFKRYVEDLYGKRLEYKDDKSPMELVVKLLLNTLYGKFGQKFLDKQNTVHVDSVTLKDIKKFKHFDRVGDYFITTQDCEPSNFCFPIWAVYVSAYGRLKLFEELKKHNVIYCDTDSIITKDVITTSKNLGDLKLEMEVEEGIVVRPKFYALKQATGESVKIKGLGRRLSYLEFEGLMDNPIVSYEKFAKFKEAIRRDFIPNEIIKVHKEFSLEDEKRIWEGEFDESVLTDSEPVKI